MRQFFALALLIGLIGAIQAPRVLAVVPQPGAAAPTVAEDVVTGIIIKYKDTALRQAAPGMLTAELARTKGLALRYKREMSGNAHVLDLQGRVSVSQAREIAKQLASDPRVLYAEPDYRMYPALTPNDPSYSNQWHYYEATGGANLPGAWNKSTGSGVVVAVIDTGYRPHADLVNNILSGGYDFITSTATANDGNGRDSNPQDPGDWVTSTESNTVGGPFEDCPVGNSSWHGTHVAGTIAAQTNNGSGVAGVAFNAKVLPVRVLGKCGGEISDLADGMRWAAGLSVSNVPANQNPAQVLNLSIGNGANGCPQSIQDAVDDILAQDVTVVAAAGNNSGNAVGYGGLTICDGVIGVAATDRSGVKAFYSNWNTSGTGPVDISAPGGETSPNTADGVLSALNTGTTSPGSDSYAYYQGTSMATPHVAGTAALLYSVAAKTGQDMAPDLAESILLDTARPFPGGACAGGGTCGAGIVDADAAVSEIYNPWVAGWLIPVLSVLH